MRVEVGTGGGNAIILTVSTARELLQFTWLGTVVIPFAVLGGTMFLYSLGYFFSSLRGRPQSKEWNAEESVPLPVNGTQRLAFYLESRAGQPIRFRGMACDIVAPNGQSTHAELVHEYATPRIQFEYAGGGEFVDPPAPTTGRYVITWLELTEKEKWRPIIRYAKDLTMPDPATPPP